MIDLSGRFIKKNKILFVFLALVLGLFSTSCTTTTTYQSVIGKPQMVSSRSILVGTIEGVNSNQSQRNFNTLNEKLNKSFGAIRFIPSSEYELALGGISKDETKEIFSNIDTRNRVFEVLKVDYFISISLNRIATSAQQAKAILNNRTVYTFKLFDRIQPSPISQFNIIVKSKKDSYHYDPNTKFYYSTPLDLDTEKAAITRAAREILNVVVQND